jgi:hypothetical protein
MPIEKVPGGFRVHNTTTKKPLTKKKALKQLAAIEISKHMQKDYQEFLADLLEDVSEKPIKKVSVIFSEEIPGKIVKEETRVVMKNKDVSEVLDKSFHPRSDIVKLYYKLSENDLKKLGKEFGGKLGGNFSKSKDIVFKIVLNLGEDKGNICYNYFFNGDSFELYPDVEHFRKDVERGIVISGKDLPEIFG